MPKGCACNLAKNTPEIKKGNADEQRSPNLKIHTLAIAKGLYEMNTAGKQKIREEVHSTFNKF